MPSNHLTLFYFLLLPLFFPASGCFPLSWLFASASVFPMNIQGWLPLRLTGLISLLSKGLSRVLSSTTVCKHQFLALNLFMVQLSHLYTTTGKNTGLTIRTFVGKVIHLLFNKLSRFVIAFLPRSQCLLISGNTKPQINQEEMSNTYLAH